MFKGSGSFRIPNPMDNGFSYFEVFKSRSPLYKLGRRLMPSAGKQRQISWRNARAAFKRSEHLQDVLENAGSTRN
jgi:hypothetical protein